MSVKPTNIPKCHLRKSADSAGNFSRHGKLGELTENIRTFALPFENQTYTFKMQYEYDSWNRMQTITYPDGEVVHYDYNLGGMLEKVYGQYKRSNMEPQIPIPHDSLIVRPMQMNTLGLNVSSGDIGPFPLYTIYTYPYIDSIAYNENELKRAVFYGNGTRSAYTYDSLQRLETLKSYNSQDSLMQNITYTYDSVSNITGISNAAGALNGLGGKYTNTYQYDNLYRLVQANGRWRGIRTLDYDLTMRYDKNGRILFKNTDYSTFIGDTTSTISYARRYRYQGSNKVATIFDEDAGDVIDFRWDDAGNMQAVIDLDNEDYRVHYWTEDNRMLQVQDKDYLSYYQYDAAGARTYKLTAAELQQRINGPNRIYYTRNGATLYASPYLVITPQGYTKHYYAETERVASQMGRGKFSDVNTSIADSTATAAKKQAVLAPIRNRQQITSSNVQFFVYLSSLTNRLNDTSECYFYHPDHLGSSSWITDSAGTAVQHIHYLPFGETFVSQRSADFDAMYTFSAKEKDTETGYLYFGARYYSSDLSIWLSVDPMADKYPSMSPYVYCANNPVKLVDPNGEEIDDDIVVYGTNNSSITYKTDLFDLQFKVDMDFGGNYNVNGENIAYGIEYGLEASAVAGTGTSYNGYKQSVKFNGGKYTDYCYDYIGGEAQIVGSGLDVSVGAQANFIIGLFLGDPNDATPESFAGDYQGVNGSRSLVSGKLIKPWGVSVDLNVSFALSKTEKKWLVITFGPSVSYGFSKYSKYTAGYHTGCSKLLGSPIPTKERSCWDMTRNKITHPNPLLWLF